MMNGIYYVPYFTGEKQGWMPVTVEPTSTVYSSLVRLLKRRGVTGTPVSVTLDTPTTMTVTLEDGSTHFLGEDQ